ncbi:unnamed protein product [Ilex paraguariensis]|uniref:Uncharacterized protein n=1 Tax=Ilex paraguariensis TaxID=185542 RepID=A0ABC8QSD6_9AQUA
MRVLAKRLSRALYCAESSSPSSSPSVTPRHGSLILKTLTTCSKSQQSIKAADQAVRGVLATPWSATQLRGAKLRGADVRPGNVVERKGGFF